MKFLKTSTARPGFTLIEILLAVSIGMMVMMAAAGMLFFVGQLWHHSESHTTFEQHTENVSQFLEHIFEASSGSSSDNEQGGNQNGGDEGPVAWRNLPGDTSLEDQLLSFRVSGELPLFYMEDAARIEEVTAFLKLEQGKGLVLNWQTDDQIREDSDEINQTILSPRVSKLEFYYYDREDNSWTQSEEQEENDDGQPLIPDFVKLSFNHEDGRTDETFVILPNANAGVPSF